MRSGGLVGADSEVALGFVDEDLAEFGLGDSDAVGYSSESVVGGESWDSTFGGRLEEPFAAGGGYQFRGV